MPRPRYRIIATDVRVVHRWIRERLRNDVWPEDWLRLMLAVFAEFERDILRDRVKAGIAQARKLGKPHGRPPTVRQRSEEIKRLYASGVSKREIAKRLGISRTSVRRLLGLSAN